MQKQNDKKKWKVEMQKKRMVEQKKKRDSAPWMYRKGKLMKKICKKERKSSEKIGKKRRDEKMRLGRNVKGKVKSYGGR